MQGSSRRELRALPYLDRAGALSDASPGIDEAMFEGPDRTKLILLLRLRWCPARLLFATNRFPGTGGTTTPSLRQRRPAKQTTRGSEWSSGGRSALSPKRRDLISEISRLPPYRRIPRDRVIEGCVSGMWRFLPERRWYGQWQQRPSFYTHADIRLSRR